MYFTRFFSHTRVGCVEFWVLQWKQACSFLLFWSCAGAMRVRLLNFGKVYISLWQNYRVFLPFSRRKCTRPTRGARGVLEQISLQKNHKKHKKTQKNTNGWLTRSCKAIKNQFTATFNQRGPNNYYFSDMIAYHGNSGVVLDLNSLTGQNDPKFGVILGLLGHITPKSCPEGTRH